MTLTNQTNIVTVRMIDRMLYEKLGHQNTSVHSVFSNTVNLLSDDALIAIGATLSFGTNRIIVESRNFTTDKIRRLDQLCVFPGGFLIGDLYFAVSKDSFYQYHCKTDRFKLTSRHMAGLLNLLKWLVQQEGVKALYLNRTEATINYQLKKIYAFLCEDSRHHAQNLIGLGMGSTPLGDDVFLGYLIAKGCVDRMPQWVKSLIDASLEKTTTISYHSFLEAYDGAYTLHIDKMLNDFFVDYNTKTLQEWIRYGDTSGAGMLAGFIFGLLTEGGMEHAGMEIIDQYLF